MQPEIEADPKEGAGSGPEQDAGPASERESPPGDLASGPGLESPPERPAAMALQPATPAERAAPPSVGRLVGSSLELLVSASADLRRLSLALGLFGVALVALPFGAVLAYGLRAASATLFAPAGASTSDGVALLAMLVALISASVAFLVLSVEVQILVAATIGGRAAGAPLRLREALKRTRQVFWRVVRGTILVGMIVMIPNLVLQALVTELVGDQTQLALAVQIFIQTLISAPFVFVVPGIVLGDVGAVEAIRRSTWLAGLRWRLALMIALLPTVGQLLLVVALFAALGVLGTAIDVGGGAPDVSNGLDPLVALAIYLFVAAAVVSLFIAIAAVQAAPQVAGFHAMTGYGAGLDEARGGRPEPLFRKPALAVYGAGLVATAVLGLVAIAPAQPSIRDVEPVTAAGITIDLPSGWGHDEWDDPALFAFNSDESETSTAFVFVFTGRRSSDALLEKMRSDFEADRLETLSRERVALGGTEVEETRFTIAWKDLIGVSRGVLELGTVGGRPAAIAVIYDPSLGSGFLDLDAFVRDEAIGFARETWASGR